MKRFVSICLLLVACVTPAYAQQQSAISDWYAGLKTADRKVPAALLSDNARVTVKSLQIVQSKEAYIESLDTWEEVIGDLELTYTTDRVDEERIVAIVCYQFSENAFTNRETFSFEDGKILSLLQEKIQDGC